MNDKLFLAFAGSHYYNQSPGDLVGARRDLEAATNLAMTKYREGAELAPGYCWYCVVEVDLATNQHKTVLDSRDSE